MQTMAQWIDRSAKCDFRRHRIIFDFYPGLPDADTLTSVVKDRLIRFSLPILQCRRQAYNGAMQ